MLLTCGLISGVLLLLGIFGTIYLDDNYDWQITTQLVGFAFGGIFTLIIFGGVATSEVNYYKYEIIPIKHITKSVDAVFVQLDGFQTQNYYLKSEYDKIDSTTIFLLKTSYNYYNFEIKHKEVEYYYDDDKKYVDKLLNRKVYD